MKKTLRTLICGVLLVVMVASMAACGGSKELQEKVDDLQARLEQQDATLKQQEETIKGLEEKEKELESRTQELENKNKELEEKCRQLEQAVDELTNGIPHEVGVVGADAGSFFEIFSGEAVLLRSKAELSAYLTVIHEQYKQYLNELFHSEIVSEKWSMRYCGGRFNYDDRYFMEDTVSEWYDEAYFDSKALIFCYFTSPNAFYRLDSHRLYIDDSALQVKIDFSDGSATMVEDVLVLLEVNQSDVKTITEVHLETVK